jgi:hypothetical protein
LNVFSSKSESMRPYFVSMSKRLRLEHVIRIRSFGEPSDRPSER